MLKVYKLFLLFSMFTGSDCCRGYMFEKKIYSAIDDSPKFEYPWLVVICDVNEKWGISYGSLIHTKAVLTAAIDIEGHNADNLYVEMDCDVTTDLVLENCLERNVTKVIYPDDYDGQATPEKFYALLILQTPFEIIPTVIPIGCISSMDLVHGDSCIVLHWLRLYSDKTDTYGVLPEAFLLPYVDGGFDAESMDLNQLQASRDFIIKGQFSYEASLNENRIPLQFSGSPISCYLKNDSYTPVQVGIATFGLKMAPPEDNNTIEYSGSAFLITDYYDEIMTKVKENVISDD